VGMVTDIIKDMERELAEAKAKANSGYPIKWVWRWQDGSKEGFYARTEEGAAARLHGLEEAMNKEADWKSLKPLLTEGERNGWFQAPDNI